MPLTILTSKISPMKILLTTLLFLCFAFAQAQEFEVPENVWLEAASDYPKYEEAVLAGIQWLEDTPVLEQVEKRQKTSAFLMSYMSGTPNFSINIFPFQMKIVESSPHLLMAFLGGWTRFALENPAEKDNALLTNKAAFQSLMNVYEINKNKGIKKEKKIEKLLKLDDAALEKWIARELGT
jgi:hypothetical protein